MEDGAQWEDEWHNVWKRFGNTTRGEVIEGALKSWDSLDAYEFPRLDLPCRYDEAKKVFNDNPDLYHLGNLPGFPFAIMRYLRKVETFLSDVLLYPDEVNRLQRRVIDLLKSCIEQWARAGADGVFFAEDWGTQERLLVSPQLWEKMFKPGFEEIIGHAKSLGIHVWMHSCGYIKDIIPHLGISAFQCCNLTNRLYRGLTGCVIQWAGEWRFGRRLTSKISCRRATANGSVQPPGR